VRAKAAWRYKAIIAEIGTRRVRPSEIRVGGAPRLSACRRTEGSAHPYLRGDVAVLPSRPRTSTSPSTGRSQDRSASARLRGRPSTSPRPSRRAASRTPSGIVVAMQEDRSQHATRANGDGGAAHQALRARTPRAGFRAGRRLRARSARRRSDASAPTITRRRA